MVKKFFEIFLKKEPKEILDCLGYYEVKPYHYFESNMTYAKDINILRTKTARVYTRWYRGTIFLLTFVDDETEFDKGNYTFEVFKDKIEKVIQEPHSSIVQLTIFKNENEKTLTIAKEPVVNKKTEFYHTFVYDDEKKRIKYYRPIPTFYKLYHNYLEAIYYDLAAIDKTR